MEGVCGKFLKTVFIFLNFLFLVLGLTALGFGLWGVISGEKVFEKDWFPTLSDKTLQDSLRENIRHAFTWLIIGACLLVGIAFLGFCGGCKENKCLLGTFFCDFVRFDSGLLGRIDSLLRIPKIDQEWSRQIDGKRARELLIR